MRARRVGVDPITCRKALAHFRMAKIKAHDSGKDYSAKSVLVDFPEEEIVAIVRYHNLDKRMSSVFDWNGFRKD